jgi:hypothetical protein
VITRVLFDLDAFYLEHRLCGDLDGDATDERAWFACECGAKIARRTPPVAGCLRST